MIQIAGVAIVLGLTFILYASLLYGSLPFWVAIAAFLAQSWAVSALIGCVLRFRIKQLNPVDSPDAESGTSDGDR